MVPLGENGSCAVFLMACYLSAVYSSPNTSMSGRLGICGVWQKGEIAGSASAVCGGERDVSS